MSYASKSLKNEDVKTVKTSALVGAAKPQKSIRKRSANFSESDKDLLLNLIVQYKGKIDCKKTDADNIASKDKAWKVLTDEFNATAHLKRGSSELSTCYANMKKRARVELALDRKEKFKTGGGKRKNAISAATEKLVGLHEPMFVPKKNPYDCDAQYVEETEERKSSQTSPVVLNEGEKKQVHQNKHDLIQRKEQWEVSSQESLAASPPLVPMSPILNVRNRRKKGQAQRSPQPSTSRETPTEIQTPSSSPLIASPRRSRPATHRLGSHVLASRKFADLAAAKINYINLKVKNETEKHNLQVQILKNELLLSEKKLQEYEKKDA